MRHADFIRAGHLDEAMRQGVLTAAQREALEAIARSAPDASARGADLGWARYGFGALTAAGLGGLAVVLLSQLHSTPVGEFALTAGLAMAALVGLGARLRRRALFEPTAAIAFAAAVGLSWAVAAALFRLPLADDPVGLTSPRGFLRWTLPADGIMLMTAFVLGRRFGAPTVAVPAGLALGHGLYRVFAVTAAGVSPHTLGTTAVALAGVLSLALGLAFDRVPGRRDWGHWWHAMAAFYLTLLPTLPASWSTPLGLGAALGLGALTFGTRRLSYLVGLAGLAALVSVRALDGAPLLLSAAACLGVLCGLGALTWRWLRRAALATEAERNPWC
ncbi:MAG: hypothetical protein JNK72_22220 [Myxococcales bacterium]|nr:hypothetical protein [Myxococcales bacterium]